MWAKADVSITNMSKNQYEQQDTITQQGNLTAETKTDIIQKQVQETW